TVKNRPYKCDHGGNDDQAKRQHPIECLVAAAAAGVNQIALDAEYVSSGPKCDVTQRPERGQIRNIYFWDDKQTAQNLIAQAEQSEIGNAEPKSNKKTKTPVFFGSRDWRGNCCRFCGLSWDDGGNLSVVSQNDTSAYRSGEL